MTHYTHSLHNANVKSSHPDSIAQIGTCRVQTHTEASEGAISWNKRSTCTRGPLFRPTLCACTRGSAPVLLGAARVIDKFTGHVSRGPASRDKERAPLGPRTREPVAVRTVGLMLGRVLRPRGRRPAPVASSERPRFTNGPLQPMIEASFT